MSTEDAKALLKQTAAMVIPYVPMAFMGGGVAGK